MIDWPCRRCCPWDPMDSHGSWPSMRKHPWAPMGTHMVPMSLPWDHTGWNSWDPIGQHISSSVALRSQILPCTRASGYLQTARAVDYPLSHNLTHGRPCACPCPWEPTWEPMDTHREAWVPMGTHSEGCQSPWEAPMDKDMGAHGCLREPMDKGISAHAHGQGHGYPCGEDPKMKRPFVGTL